MSPALLVTGVLAALYLVAAGLGFWGGCIYRKMKHERALLEGKGK